MPNTIGLGAMKKKVVLNQIPCKAIFSLQIPKGAEILSTGMDVFFPFIYYMCDPEQEFEERNFRLVECGEQVWIEPGQWKYIGSFQMLSKTTEAVKHWHLFEVKC